MCHPAWRQARVTAHHLSELARLRRVRDRIDREYARPLDVDALARDAGMSPGHLGRLFRRAYGRSPYSYLMARRVDHATALLRRGDLGVAEVRTRVGCPSPGVFGSHFAERVGTDPGLYRRRAGGMAGAGGVGASGEGVEPVAARPAGTGAAATPPVAARSAGTGAVTTPPSTTRAAATRPAEPVRIREAPAALPSLAWQS